MIMRIFTNFMAILPFAVDLRVETDSYGSRIRIKFEKLDKYLCFNKRRRVTTKVLYFCCFLLLHSFVSLELDFLYTSSIFFSFPQFSFLFLVFIVSECARDFLTMSFSAKRVKGYNFIY